MLTEEEFCDWFDKNNGTDEAYGAAWHTYRTFFLGVDDSLTTLQNIARLELARAELDVKIAYMKLQAMLEAVSSPIAARIIMQLRGQIKTADEENSLKMVAAALAHGSIGYNQFNEIIELFPEFMAAMASKKGVTVGQLRTYAIEGRLDTRFVIDALGTYCTT